MRNRNRLNNRQSTSSRRILRKSSPDELFIQSKSEEKDYYFKSYLFPQRTRNEYYTNTNNIYQTPLFSTKQSGTNTNVKSVDMQSTCHCSGVKLNPSLNPNQKKKRYVLKVNPSVKAVNTNVNVNIIDNNTNYMKKTHGEIMPAIKRDYKNYIITAIDMDPKAKLKTKPKITKIKKLKLKMHQKTKSLNILTNKS